MKIKNVLCILVLCIILGCSNKNVATVESDKVDLSNMKPVKMTLNEFKFDELMKIYMSERKPNGFIKRNVESLYSRTESGQKGTKITNVTYNTKLNGLRDFNDTTMESTYESDGLDVIGDLKYQPQNNKKQLALEAYTIKEHNGNNTITLKADNSTKNCATQPEAKKAYDYSELYVTAILSEDLHTYIQMEENNENIKFEVSDNDKFRKVSIKTNIKNSKESYHGFYPPEVESDHVHDIEIVYNKDTYFVYEIRVKKDDGIVPKEPGYYDDKAASKQYKIKYIYYRQQIDFEYSATKA